MQGRRRIDPRADRAVYRQIADVIRADISAGVLRPGQYLPAEHRLSEQYEVSRNSVRDALKLLRAEGLIVTERPAGSRVLGPKERAVIDVPPGSTIIARVATAEECARLDLEQSTWLLEVRLAGGATNLYVADRTEIRTTGQDVH